MLKTLIRHVALCSLLMLSTSAMAEDEQQWGPAQGSELAAFELQNQAGELQTTADLSGENGLLIFFVRSADW